MTDGNVPERVDSTLRDAASRVARAAGLRLVVMFGSTARFVASPEDLDLAVLASDPVDAVELTNRFTTLLGFQEVDVVDLRRADPVLLVQVAQEGIPLFESAPGEFASFCSLATRRFADTRKFRDAEREAIRSFVPREGRER